MPGTTAKAYADNILNWEKGTAMPTAPTNLYLALLTTMPTKGDGTSLVEASGTGYARIQITPGQWAAITTNGDNQTEQAATNAAQTFTVGAGGWGTIVGVAIYDALTVGSLLKWATLSTGNIATVANNVISFPSGNLVRTQS